MKKKSDKELQKRKKEIISSIKKINKDTRLALSTPYLKIFENFHQQQREMLKSLAPLQINISLQAAMSKRIAEIAKPIITQTRMLSKAAKEYKRRGDKIKKSEQRWILYDKLPIVLLSFYDVDNHKFVNFLNHSDEVKVYIKMLKTNKYFLPHIKIIERAFLAHSQKDYEVSIPLFFICIDGVLINFGKKNGLVSGKNIKKKVKGRKPLANMKSISKEVEGTYGIIDKKFISFMDKEVKSNVRKYKGLWQFRNDVMHGIQPNYSDEQWSIKLIFVLRLLYDSLR